MAPDIEDLIKRVNSLTLDKNRLKQKLTQLNQASGGATTAILPGYNSQYISSRRSSPPSSNNSNQQQQQQQHSQENLRYNETGNRPNVKRSLSSDSNSPTTPKSPSSSSLAAQQQTAKSISNRSSNGGGGGLPNRMIAGIECATSCEEDLVFMNELYRKRLDEYNEKWDYIQSKCSALLSELNALQEHFALQKREKLELEEKLKESCDENESIRSELQTVVLNYETQLSAMSEHLSMITSKVALDDDDGLARVQ